MSADAGSADPCKDAEASAPSRRFGGLRAALVGITGAAVAWAAAVCAGAQPLAGVVPHVPTLSALGAAAHDAGRAVRDGYAAPGDTPPVDYVYRTPACSAPDGGLQVPAAGGGCWTALVAGDAVPVGLWGVSPAASGAANTAAFTAALNALPPDGHHLTFGPGVYTFAAQVRATLPTTTSSLTLSGAGQQATRLDWTEAPGGIALRAPDNVETSIVARDFALTTRRPDGGSGLTLTQDVLPGAPVGSTIARVLCQGGDGPLKAAFWTSCIAVHGWANVTVDAITVVGSADAQGGGIDLQGGRSVAGAPTSYGIVYDIAGSAFFTTRYGIRYGGFTQGVTVSNSNFTNGVNGIVSPASAAGSLNQLTVSGSQFNTTGDAIRTETAIAGFQSIGSTYFVASGTCGINLDRNAYFSITGGNRFEAFGSTPPVNTTGVRIGRNVDKVSVGLLAGNSYSALTVGNLLDDASANVVVGANAYDGAVATAVENRGHGNTVMSGKPVYEATVVIPALGAGATFSLPLPVSRHTATVAAAAPAGSQSLAMASTATVFAGDAVSGPGIAAGTRVQAVLPTGIALSGPGTTAPIAAGATLVFADALFSGVPIVTLTNGAAEASPGYPVVDYAASDATQIAGSLVGARPGTAARINIRAVAP